MRFTLPSSVLLNAVGQAAGVAAAKSPKRILECVAIRATEKDGVVIEANDLDVSLRMLIPDAQVSEPGVVVVPATRLVSVLREVGEGTKDITLVGADNRLDIDTEQCHFRIHGDDPAEFPAVPAFPAVALASVEAAVLRGMIDRTLFATAREPGRFALHGVQLKLSKGELELVATDGRRLAKAVSTTDGASATEAKVIVGTKPLSLLSRLAGGDGPRIDMAVEERRIFFRSGGTVLSSRLIDGSFPPYDQVIPPASARGFEAPAGDLATALRRASLLTTKEAQSVTMDFGPRRLTLSSRAPEVGEAKVELEIGYDDAPERLGFNPVFILDALKVMDPARPVRFEFTNPKAPGKLTDGAGYVYVVMPVSVAEGS